MSSENPDKLLAAPRRLTAAEVSDYLMRHPSFLAKHPDVLAHQALTKSDMGGNVVNFQAAQLERLRDETVSLRAFRDEVLEAARANLTAQGLIHEAVLALLETNSLESLIHAITQELAGALGIDAVTLCVEAGDPALERPGMNNLLLVEPGLVDAVIGQGRPSRLMGNTTGDPAIFGPAAGLVRSQALVRIEIGDDSPVGLVAFGSREAVKYDAGQGSELLNFLGRVIERLIHLWLRVAD